MALSGAAAAAVVLGCLFAALGALVAAVLITIAFAALLVRPWDGDVQRDHRWATRAPFPVFWAVSWLIRAAERVVALKPGPLRAAELATMYTQSAVLFSLVELGIPDALAAGPRTATQLARVIGPSVNVEWLDRLLAAAAAMGMLNRLKGVRRRPVAAYAANAAAAVQQHKQQQLAAAHGKAGDIEAPGAAAAKGISAAAGAACQVAPSPPASDDELALPAGEQAAEYGLNGVSAVLTSASPVCMSSFVKLFDDHADGYRHLAEGIRRGVVPFELWSGGRDYWQHISASARHAATFDAAMAQVNHIGGAAVVTGFPWRRYDTVIDVAGGVGAFVADLVARQPGLRGAVLDQEQQIARARQLWQAPPYSELAPRVSLVAGDMFDATTIPEPPPAGRVAYTLRNILHDWPEADCVRILSAIRGRISVADVAAKRIDLLLVEVTTAEEVLPCHLPFRRSSDVTMLMAFGGGAERNKAQFAELLGAAGFRLRRITPTNGIFLVVEAEAV